MGVPASPRRFCMKAHVCNPSTGCGEEGKQTGTEGNVWAAGLTEMLNSRFSERPFSKVKVTKMAQW